MPFPNKTILFSNHGCISFIHIHPCPYTCIVHATYGSTLRKDNPQRRMSILDSKNGFWNEVLENELPKTHCKSFMFVWHSNFVNANISSRLLFNNLQNCPITINYVVCPKLFMLGTWELEDLFNQFDFFFLQLRSSAWF
jgi:hypothetical protein